MACERVAFTRRELRERLSLGDTQLKVHLARLVGLELLSAHRGQHGVFLYQLAYNDTDATAGGVLLPGLIDLDQGAGADRQHVYDGDRSGSLEDRSGAGRPPVGAGSVAGRPAGNGVNPSSDGRSRAAEHDQARSNGSRGSFLAAVTVAAAEAGC